METAAMAAAQVEEAAEQDQLGTSAETATQVEELAGYCFRCRKQARWFEVLCDREGIGAQEAENEAARGAANIVWGVLGRLEEQQDEAEAAAPEQAQEAARVAAAQVAAQASTQEQIEMAAEAEAREQLEAAQEQLEVTQQQLKAA